MHAIQVGQLKSEFSSILDKIQNDGETFVIEYGKKHKKVAILIPYDVAYEQKEEIKFGYLKDKATFNIHKDFKISDSDFLSL